jgi:phosphatidylglycerophosphatase A
MSIKESSDELNPPSATAEELGRAFAQSRSPRDYLALAIATCGVGYLPLAPGTWGSLVAVGLYFVVRVLVYSPLTTNVSPLSTQRDFVLIEVAMILIATIVGVWAASQTERLLGVKDPGKVVIDEVAGQLIALLPVPLTTGQPWTLWLIPAFLLFRFFDIVKPYPARKFESFHGGSGIMADDIVAGVYAAIVLWIFLFLRQWI